MTARLIAILFVAGAYLLMLASLDPLDALLGLVLATGLVLGLGDFLFAGGSTTAGRSLPRSLLRFVPFAAAVVWDITKGTGQVALVVLHLRPLERPGIVAIPIGRRTRTGVVVTTLVSTLSPGEFLVDVDWERDLIYMHVLDARDPDDVRARFEEFYRRYQEPVFP